MLKVKTATEAEFSHYYTAMQLDFDEKELLPKIAIRRAIRRGDLEFLLFCDDATGLTEGYALCGIRNVYGYVMLKYFGIFSWYQGQGIGVEAMRLLHRRYADCQGILAELTAFDDGEDGEYLRKLKRFFSRFGYEEVPFSYRIGGAEAVLTVKPVRGTADVGPIARRLIMDFYSRCLRPSEAEKMLSFSP